MGVEGIEANRLTNQFGNFGSRIPAMSVAYRDCQQRCRGTLADRLGHGNSPQAAQDFKILLGDQVTLIDIEPTFAICHRYIRVFRLIRRKRNLQLASNSSGRLRRPGRAIRG